MYNVKNIIVISDLHIAATQSKGLFQVDEALTGFLSWITEMVSPCLLVLNGDILDFLVDRKPKVVTEAEEASTQTRAILENHQEVFDALRNLVNSTKHQLIIIGGNHDPEIIFPEVQQVITRRLKQLSAPPPIRWVVNGEGLSFRVAGAKILIEHGDQYDDFNFIDHESLRRLVSLSNRRIPGRNVYTPPPGSQLVVNRLNLIRSRFPWIEQLHPLDFEMLRLIVEVVLPQLEKTERASLWGVINEVTQTGRRSVIRYMLRQIKAEAGFWAEQDDERKEFNLWRTHVEKENTWEKSEQDIDKMIVRLRRPSGRDNYFNIERPDRAFEAVSLLTETGNDVIIHGHTHMAKAYKVGQGLYLNSGTWAQMMHFPKSDASDSEWRNFIRNLEKGEANGFSCSTFIWLMEEEDKVKAQLCEWKDGGPEIRSAWVFEQSKRQWKEEKSG